MSHVDQLLCPNCGHHVADVTRAEQVQEVRKPGSHNVEHAKSFLTACVRSEPEGRVTSELMHAAYVRWAQKNNLVPIGPKALGMALRELGVAPYRTSLERGYRHVRVDG